MWCFIVCTSYLNGFQSQCFFLSFPTLALFTFEIIILINLQKWVCFHRITHSFKHSNIHYTVSNLLAQMLKDIEKRKKNTAKRIHDTSIKHRLQMFFIIRVTLYLVLILFVTTHCKLNTGKGFWWSLLFDLNTLWHWFKSFHSLHPWNFAIRFLSWMLSKFDIFIVRTITLVNVAPSLHVWLHGSVCVISILAFEIF